MCGWLKPCLSIRSLAHSTDTLIPVPYEILDDRFGLGLGASRNPQITASGG